MRQDLFFEVGFVFRMTNEIPFLSEKNKQARISFSKFLLTLPREMLIWCDEVAFPLQRKTLKGEWMKKSKPKLIMQKNPNPKIHIWGAISLIEKSKIYILPCKMTWTSENYKNMLNEILLEFVLKHYKDETFYFIQDTARAHKKHTITWMKESIKNYMFLPPKSCDLNPIERIWSIMKDKIYAGNKIYSNRICLIEAINKVWESLESEEIKKHINHSIEKRYLACINANGEFINKY